MAGIIDDLKMQYRLGGPENRLIFINVGLYVLSIVFFYRFKFGFFEYPDWLALYPNLQSVLFHPWTVVTYMFFHGGVFHLIFNMFVLNFSGRLFRTFFTGKQFLGAYLLGGIFAGLVFVASFMLLGRANPLVGASAAIMTILVAATTYQPDMRLRLMFIGEVKLVYLTLVLIAIDMLSLFVENTGGHISHLAGALFGFVYIKALLAGVDLGKPVSAVLDFFANGFRSGPKPKFRKVHRNYRTTSAAASRVAKKDRTQQQIDEILDKISRSGYDSLTKEEKDFLFRSGK